MALEAPYGERLLLPVELFPNAGGGFGYGVTKKTSMPEGYDRTLNMSVRDGDVLAPSLGVNKLAMNIGANTEWNPAWVVAWQNGATSPPLTIPGIVLAGVGAAVHKLEGGTDVAEAPGLAANNYIAGFAFHDDGSGGEYLYIGSQGFGSSSSDYLIRRTPAGTYTRASGGVQLVLARFLVSAGGALWRTLYGAGASSDYQVSKCPSGSEPFTLASWGAAIAVGTQYGNITALGALGAAPVVFKTDGIWVYNTADNLFENQFPVDPHPDNFPFAKPDGAGGLYSALHDGSIVHITRFGSLSVEHPLKGKTPARDTPRGPITDLTIWADRVFAVMAGCYRLVQPPGFVFLKTIDNMVSFTDYSAQVVDADFATVANINSLPSGAGGGYVLIGFDQPILAVQLLVNGRQSVVTPTTAQISTGAGAWAAVNVVDGMIESPLQAPFSRPGTLYIQANSTLSAWALATYNANSKYWLRLSWGTALGAGTSIGTAAVVVKRPAPNFGQTNTPNSPSGEASGAAGKIIMGTIKPGGIVWDDLYTIDSESYGPKLCVSQLPLPNSPSASLVVATATDFHQFPLPNILESSVVEYPNLARDAAGKLAPIYYPSAVDLGTVHFLRYVEIIGANLVEGVDSWGFSWRWDDRNAWDNDKTGTGKIASTSALFKIDDQIGGTVLHTAIQLLDANNTDPVGPSGRKIICWVEAAPIRASQQVEPTRTLVEVS